MCKNVEMMGGDPAIVEMRDDWLVLCGLILECFKTSLESISWNILAVGSCMGKALGAYDSGKARMIFPFWNQRWYREFHLERRGWSVRGSSA